MVMVGFRVWAPFRHNGPNAGRRGRTHHGPCRMPFRHVLSPNLSLSSQRFKRAEDKQFGRHETAMKPPGLVDNQ